MLADLLSNKKLMDDKMLTDEIDFLRGKSSEGNIIPSNVSLIESVYDELIKFKQNHRQSEIIIECIDVGRYNTYKRRVVHILSQLLNLCHSRHIHRV
jgi:hypothetical protein